MSQPPDDHLKALWQGQETETPAMTALAVRALARNHGTLVRDRYLILGALVAIEAAFFGHLAWRAPNDGVRIGSLIMLFSLAWIVWRLRRRWPGRLPDTTASADALIDFHRLELSRQRYSYGDMLVTAGPTFAGAAVLLYGLHMARPQAGLEKFDRFFALMAVWLIAAWFIQRRQARRIQSQIDEMDDLARR